MSVGMQSIAMQNAVQGAYGGSYDPMNTLISNLGAEHRSNIRFYADRCSERSGDLRSVNPQDSDALDELCNNAGENVDQLTTTITIAQDEFQNVASIPGLSSEAKRTLNSTASDTISLGQETVERTVENIDEAITEVKSSIKATKANANANTNTNADANTTKEVEIVEPDTKQIEQSVQKAEQVVTKASQQINNDNNNNNNNNNNNVKGNSTTEETIEPSINDIVTNEDIQAFAENLQADITEDVDTDTEQVTEQVTVQDTTPVTDTDTDNIFATQANVETDANNGMNFDGK